MNDPRGGGGGGFSRTQSTATSSSSNRRGSGNGAAGRGRGRRNQKPKAQQHEQEVQVHSKAHSSKSDSNSRKKLLLLHGSRQTSEVLLGRLERLQKRLLKEFNLEVIAPDAPFSVHDYDNNDNSLLLTWWNRVDNDYQGLDTTLELLRSPAWNNQSVVGIMGFSQGAGLTHLLARLHQRQPQTWFSNLQFVILVAGYDAPLPDHHMSDLTDQPSSSPSPSSPPMSIPSLHVWGIHDSLVTPAQSQAVCQEYIQPTTYPHSGTHFVPTKGTDLQAYCQFLERVLLPISSSPPITASDGGNCKNDLVRLSHSPSLMLQQQQQQQQEVSNDDKVNSQVPSANLVVTQDEPIQSTIPDEEMGMMQRDEIEALQAMFPEEIQIRSVRPPIHGETTSSVVLDFPIKYRIKLLPADDHDHDDRGDSRSDRDGTQSRWPIHPLTLEIQYPFNYPLDAIPQYQLLHENNNFEFPSTRVDSIMHLLKETSQLELGMPSVLSAIYAVREYLDAPPSADDPSPTNPLLMTLRDGEMTKTKKVNVDDDEDDDDATNGVNRSGGGLIPPSSLSQIQQGNLEGLEVAQGILKRASSKLHATGSTQQQQQQQTLVSSSSSTKSSAFWNYVIGLVGKPSAGKSTFFNAATAFSRQRGSGEDSPANINNNNNNNNNTMAGTGDFEWGGASMAAHPFTTIDPNIGYCLIPAPLGACPEDNSSSTQVEDPKAFASTHGRAPDGRRLLPVLLKDVAGLVPGAYQGRGRGDQFFNDLTDATVLIHVVDASGTADAQGNKTVLDHVADDGGTELTNPMDDLAWIRNELVEWVYSNVTAKWETIRRKGRVKLVGMFSGYGQREAETETILSALEEFLEEKYGRDRSMEHLDQWDQADIHRLVSCFLGVRFPMALALNKCDLQSGQKFAKDILQVLPIHGAHVGTSMAAHEEMLFVRNHLKDDGKLGKANGQQSSPPTNVWNCLTSAMTLREPVLVFPVSDLTTYAPLCGLNRGAAESPSLPSIGMIRCIQAAGGCVPTCWDDEQKLYVDPNKGQSSKQKLRDVLVMKPGCTVEDVFFALKRLGGLSGEFARAEAVGNIGDKPKPIPKLEVMGKRNRIIRIMSNKRTAWQN